MKISTEQLRALQEIEGRRVKTSRDGDDFSALLTRRLDIGQSQGSAGTDAAAPLAPGLRSMPLAGIMDDASFSDSQSEARTAAGQMENMFSALERYADELARNEKADLRKAYGMLKDMDKQMAGFKSRYPGANAERPELAALANELDVLVTAETFKFNRGDYIA